MLTLLISGPRNRGNDIEVYLAHLVNDLKKFWSEGVEAYDAYKEESFILQAILMWTINDFLAYGKLSGCGIKRYYACPVYWEGTCGS